MDKERYSAPTEARLMVIDEQISQIGKLLSYASKGKDSSVSEIIADSRGIEDSYLAYETVRKGSRAGIIVGNIYHENQRLPFTGLEPYTVGSGMKAEEIVRLEASEGQRVMKIINRNGYGYDYFKALKGEKVDSHTIQELSDIYGGLIARFKAVGESETSQFRADTYSHIRRLPDISYQVNGRDLSQTIVVPRIPEEHFPATRVELSDSEVKGYLLIAEFGRFGHPLVRESLRRLN